MPGVSSCSRSLSVGCDCRQTYTDRLGQKYSQYSCLLLQRQQQWYLSDSTEILAIQLLAIAASTTVTALGQHWNTRNTAVYYCSVNNSDSSGTALKYSQYSCLLLQRQQQWQLWDSTEILAIQLLAIAASTTVISLGQHWNTRNTAACYCSVNNSDISGTALKYSQYSCLLLQRQQQWQLWDSTDLSLRLIPVAFLRMIFWGSAVVIITTVSLDFSQQLKSTTNNKCAPTAALITKYLLLFNKIMDRCTSSLAT